MKRSQADIYFSKCVRASVDYVCQRCGAVHNESSTGLHCSHNFGRRHRTIRWCKDNAIPLCASCHAWYGENPYESGQWLEQFMGIGALELLIEKKNSKQRVTKLDEKEIAKHYREQLKIIQEKRANGELGIIDFESWQ